MTLQPVGAFAILINSQNQVLIGKRKNGYKAGYYGFPGGRIDLNESIEAALVREVAEETGILIAKPEYVGVIRENQADYDFIHFAFVVRDVTQQPKTCEPDKCEGWEWFGQAELPEQILPGHQAGLKMLFGHKQLIDLTS